MLYKGCSEHIDKLTGAQAQTRQAVNSKLRRQAPHGDFINETYNDGAPIPFGIYAY
jgi:hypothetical protein